MYKSKKELTQDYLTLCQLFLRCDKYFPGNVID